MTLPEQGSLQFEELQTRAHRSIVDLVANIAIRRGDLPPTVHAVIYDEITEERCGAYVFIQYLDGGKADIARTALAVFRQGNTIGNVADMLIKTHPEIPLVCDKRIASELSQESLTWMDGDHYRLEGRQSGILEVYTPYRTDSAPQEMLPPGIESIQWYSE